MSTTRHRPIGRLLPLLLLLASALASCESPTSSTPRSLDSTVVGSSDHAVFVLNEGSFGSTPNASLDLVIIRGNGKDTVVDHNVLTNLSVGNAVHVFGHFVYVIDNGAHQIVKISADSLKTVGTLSFGMDSPNDIALIGPDRAIIPMLFSPYAEIVDLAAMRVLDTVQLGENCTEVGVLNGKAYISTWSTQNTSHLVVYDIATNRIVTSLPMLVSGGPVAVDSVNNHVLVAAFPTYDSAAARIYWLDASTDSFVDSTDASTKTWSLSFIAGGNKLFSLDDGAVMQIDASTHSLMRVGITGNFYNGAYDAKTDELYLGHNDFSGNRGIFDVYGASDHKLHWSDTAGIAPAHFAFYH